MADRADWTTVVRRRLSLTGLQAAREAEIVEDVARQLDDAYREAIASGASETDARARAERHIADWDALARELSATSRLRQPAVDRWSERRDDRVVTREGQFSHLARLRQDLVHGWRTFRRTPALTAVAILTLALGIGANTAIFSVMRALMFRSLPVAHPETLVVLTDPESEGMMSGIEEQARTLLSYHEFEGLRDGAGEVLDDVFAFSSSVQRVPLTTDGIPAGATGFVSLVSGRYFPTLGVVPAAGRVFGVEVDAARLKHPVAVVSHRFWRSRLNEDPAAIGRTIRIRQTLFQIVGVMPPEFSGLVIGSAPDLWVPVTMQEAIAPGRDWLAQPPGLARRTMFLHVLGRLKPGVSLAQANTALDAVFRRNLQTEAEQIADPERRKSVLNANLVVRDARYGLSSLRAEYRQPLYVLMGLVGLLLVLACANIANLLLARATGRGRELALRVALGAGRARLIRQLLTESVMLAGMGAAAGLLVAYWGDRLLIRLVSGNATSVSLDTPIDAGVLAFAAGLTILTGVLFGLAPAIRATAVDLNLALRGTAANIAGATRRPGRWPMGKVLAGAQVGISVLLLIAAGLFVRTFQHLADAPVGYDTDRLLMFRLNPLIDGHKQPSLEPLFEQVLQRLESLPGVRGATLSYDGLFYGRELGAAVSFAGMTPPAGADMDTAFDLVAPKYFSTIGIPVRLGRDVASEDSTGLPGCWLNQTAASDFFKDDSPLGRRMTAHFSFGDLTFEVRGVVADARSQSVRGDVGRRVYLPFFGSGVKPTDAVFEIRAAGDPKALVPGLRAAIQEVNNSVTLPTFFTVPELIGEGLARDRLTAQLSMLFSALALVLASIGLYGVLSYNVGRRVSEIGVRLALGARRGGIIGLVVREALMVTVAGLAVGLAAALAATRLVETMLFGLTPRDPLTFVGAAAVLLVVAALSAAAPAWRASRTDPLTALRTE
jgi:predicted permease